MYIALAGLLIASFYIAATMGINYILQMKVKNALEAAALQAANDLSCIVINDPYWGYVSLTDHPPVGEATFAKDEEPLPVIGINTIMSAVRQELLTAKAIGSNDAFNCALEDYKAAKLTQRRLEDKLINALSQRSLDLEDMNGNLVRPIENAEKIFNLNTKQLATTCGFKLESLRLELGYLNSGSTTNAKVRGSLENLEVSEKHVNNGRYRAFIDIPAAGQSVYFAGLGKQASLVNANDFSYPDGEKMCSVVRLTAKLTKNIDGSKIKIRQRACAQPFFEEDKTKPPIMVLNFPHGLPSKLKSMKDLLSSNDLKTKIPLLTAKGGDYPIDPGSRLEVIRDLNSQTVRYAINRGYMDWLRAGHGKANIDSLINNLNERFSLNNKTSTSRVYLYGIDNKGIVQIIKPKKIAFRKQTTYNKQLYTVAFNSISSDNMFWTFKVRDQVRNLGTINGGKHAGQPMPSIAYIDELNSLLAQNPREDRFGGKAGSRYDQSRLAIEFEISSPQHLSSVNSNLF